MTIVLKNGQRYSANHIAVVRRNASTESDLSFVCSGQMIVKPADAVERIEYRETGATHCEGCDQ